MYQYRIQQLLFFETEKSEVVNLELEVLKMKIIIIFIDLLMATVLFFVGRFFIKSRNTERSVLFLSGDYTGLNTEKICRVTGKRIKTWAMLFCLGGIIEFYHCRGSDKFQLCAQLRVCSQAGGIPVYPRFSQPDNSESWDDAGNGI